MEKQLNLISCLQPKNYKTMNHLSDVFFLSLASTQETIFVFTIHKRRETSVFRPSNYFFSSSICFYTTKLANTKKIPQHPHKYEQKNTRPSSQKLYTKTEREREREMWMRKGIPLKSSTSPKPQPKRGTLRLTLTLHFLSFPLVSSHIHPQKISTFSLLHFPFNKV